MEKTSKRIGEILVEKGIITEAQLFDALREQKSTGGFLGEIMVNKGWISEESLFEALANQFGITFVNIKNEHLEMELARKFSSSLILDHKCFPLKQDEFSITFAIVNPLDVAAIAKIEEEAKPRKVSLVLVTDKDLKETLQEYRKYISESIQRLLRKDKKTEN